MTAAQRRHAREQRALLALRRAAVRYVNAVDDVTPVLGVLGAADDDDILEAATDLVAAAQRYASGLSMSERRRMGKRR